MLCYYGIGDRLSCHYKYIIFIVENMHMINEEEVNKLCHGFIKMIRTRDIFLFMERIFNSECLSGL